MKIGALAECWFFGYKDLHKIVTCYLLQVDRQPVFFCITTLLDNYDFNKTEFEYKNIMGYLSSQDSGHSILSICVTVWDCELPCSDASEGRTETADGGCITDCLCVSGDVDNGAFPRASESE